MKKFKKLIPAFCAMLVSAAMLGTSTYAWFSVNKKVEAKGMSVTAQANTQYFVISTDTTFGTEIEKTLTETQITQKGTAGTGTVYPAAYGVKNEKGLADKWWTANVSKYDSTTAGDIINVSEIKVDAGEVYTNSQYFVGYSFYVGLNEKSDDFAAAKLQASVVAGAEANAAKVAAVAFEQWEGATKKADGNSEFVQIEGKTADGTSHGYQTTQTYELSAGETKKFVKVTVYLFVDGNDGKIKDTAEAADLTGKVGVKIAAATETL